jgi:hypothetical protein
MATATRALTPYKPGSVSPARRNGPTPSWLADVKIVLAAGNVTSTMP